MTTRTVLFSILLPLALAACGGGEETPSGSTAGHDHGAGETSAAVAATAAADAWRLPAADYPAGTEQLLDTALATYDDVRGILAADSVDGLAPRARRLADALGAAAAAVEGGAAEPFLSEARLAANGLVRGGEAGDLEAARLSFAELSRFLMPVVAADAGLVGDRIVYSCPMATGFNKWIQTSDEPANPYMGPDMATCRIEDDWAVAMPASMGELAAHAESVHDADPDDPGAVAFYTCPMHPSVKATEPGGCPICGMDLVAVSEGEVSSGVVVIDDGRRQRIGVRTAPVERRAVGAEIRAVGRVTWDETRRTEVSVKYEGWIGRLYVDETGQSVRRGQPLFTLYSPQLFAAQQELLTALASQRAAQGTSAPERADYLVRAARERLRLWDLSAQQIDRVAESGEPIEQIPILSPTSGVVVEKMVVAGAAVRPGMTLFSIAGLDRVWVEADVYESELPLVEEGQRATVTFPYLPGEELSGTVGFVYPYLDGTTRTGRVRVELANPGGKLKPDMFAHVTLERELGERLVVPEQAVLYAGPRSFVFVDLGEGRLKPQRVETGLREEGWVEVLSGVTEGDVIVT
ncbi:MAG TPA: efflux RND transporter periplasmic adaptor subunit, partial [Thermoanaerobaculia bacterium]|nr:efflux RND transporter periplasmic adaptor subunit [Thermoanaerobaculia bacterium]